jgi:hypothetical protein
MDRFRPLVEVRSLNKEISVCSEISEQSEISVCSEISEQCEILVCSEISLLPRDEICPFHLGSCTEIFRPGKGFSMPRVNKMLSVRDSSIH